MEFDMIIIGAGVVGCAVARELSRYEGRICVIEKGSDVAEGASKANSGIIHAGFDARPGTLKAKLNVEGAKCYPQLCKELHVAYAQPGALVIGFSQEDRTVLERLMQQGVQNGVEELRLLEREEILSIEPNINPQVICALYAPTSGLVSPYEVTFALADAAAVCGVQFRFNETVETVDKMPEGVWRVRTQNDQYIGKILINCAGIGAAHIHNMITGEKLTMIPRRGQYYLLDRMDSLPFQRTMFQCPSKMGKGVLVSPTVHGNLLLGPSAEDIETESDKATTAEGLAFVLQKSKLTWPNATCRENITNFSGVRAHLETDDFIVGATAENAYETLGIESPGLSAAPAIARMLREMIVKEQGLAEKDILPKLPQRKKPFSQMTDEERYIAVKEDPLYGNVVCRCETVTEAEIRAAIRRPVGAKTVDGVKRRVRSGMGRCQGGFCGPKVAEILAEELGIPISQVTKSGGNSLLLTGDIGEGLMEEQI